MTSRDMTSRKAKLVVVLLVCGLVAVAGCRLKGTGMKPGIEPAGPNKTHSLPISSASMTVGPIEVSSDFAEYEVEKTLAGERNRQLRIGLRFTNHSQVFWPTPFRAPVLEMMNVRIEGEELPAGYSVGRHKHHRLGWDVSGDAVGVAPGSTVYGMLTVFLSHDVRGKAIDVQWRGQTLRVTP